MHKRKGKSKDKHLKKKNVRQNPIRLALAHFFFAPVVLLLPELLLAPAMQVVSGDVLAGDALSRYQLRRRTDNSTIAVRFRDFEEQLRGVGDRNRLVVPAPCVQLLVPLPGAQWGLFCYSKDVGFTVDDLLRLTFFSVMAAGRSLAVRAAHCAGGCAMPTLTPRDFYEDVEMRGFALWLPPRPRTEAADEARSPPSPAAAGQSAAAASMLPMVFADLDSAALRLAALPRCESGDTGGRPEAPAECTRGGGSAPPGPPLRARAQHSASA